MYKFFFIFLVLLSTLSAKKLTNIPIIFSTSEMGLGTGISSIYTVQSKNQDKVNTFSGTGFLTTKGQSAFFLAAENYFKPNYKYKLGFRHSYFPTNFYGIGTDTKFKNQEKLNVTHTSFSPAVLKQLGKYSYFGPILDAGVLEEKNNYLGAGFSFDYDTRDKVFYPMKGQFLTVNTIFYVDDFYKQNIEFRDFRRLAFKKDWVLANRAVIDCSQNNVPLWLLPEVSLRGIESTRFIDKTSINLEEELRFPFAKKWKGAVFCGVGNVARDIASFEIEQTKLAAGVGVRYVLEEEQSVNFTFDFAVHNINDDDKKVYFYFKVLERF